MFTAQFAEITQKKRLLMSGGLGTMGYGLPGAIGAKIGNPDVPVISISGDGGMQMNIQELATAVLEELPIISCIFNNYNLGMVRQWQKLFYGKRYPMTDLRAGAALVIAGLAGDGITIVDDIYYIERGYEAFDEKFRGLGGMMEKVSSEKEIQQFRLKI